MEPVDPIVWIVLVAIVVVVILVLLAFRRRRSDTLRQRFGEEYDRTVAVTGKRSAAEAELQERERRVAGLDIRPLDAEERSRFTREWREVKAVFVDSPVEAVHHADRLVTEIMRARGYPMADFERRHADLSVDHAEVANHYRAGHEITERDTRGEATTEDMRQAMIHFEALFEELTTEGEGQLDRPATAGPGRL